MRTICFNLAKHHLRVVALTASRRRNKNRNADERDTNGDLPVDMQKLVGQIVEKIAQ